MKLEIFETEDGSHSIFVPHLKEQYHSFHGAIAESKHVYIKSGLQHILKSNEKIKILEIGFGTGLNAYLTLLESVSKNRQFSYTTLEPFPLDEKIYKQLNYPIILGNNEIEKKYFQTIYSCDWNKWIAVSENFALFKSTKSLQDFKSEEKYDLIYFDAFAPEIQPDLWTKELFEKLFFAMEPSGVLVTYCAKGIVKRTLKELGFSVESLPGPTGKREIIRAIK